MRGLMLARQALYHLSHSLNPFSFSYFSHSLQTGLDNDPPDHCLLHSWDDSHEPLHPASEFRFSERENL
jgi:hypothetical protein